MALCATLPALAPCRALRVFATIRTAPLQPLSSVPRLCQLTPLRHERWAPVRPAAAAAVPAAAAAVQQASGMSPAYGYLMASVAFTAAVLQWMGLQVFKARKEAGVAYPNMTAEGNTEAGNKFNCAQRVHHNTLENLPMFLVMQLLVAQVYPMAAAAIGCLWTLGRIIYALGYSTGDPSKRVPGSMISNFTSLATIILLACTSYAVITA